jgi:hypothetical protein
VSRPYQVFKQRSSFSSSVYAPPQHPRMSTRILLLSFLGSHGDCVASGIIPKRMRKSPPKFEKSGLPNASKK